MKKEDKELILKDLSARQPYGVFVGYEHYTDRHIVTTKLTGIRGGLYYDADGQIPDNELKPYLRQMSDMTEKEKREFSMFIHKTETYKQQVCLDSDSMVSSVIGGFPCVYLSLFDKFVDWLIKHHIDFRGLIAKGLAIKAPEGMYKFE